MKRFSVFLLGVLCGLSIYSCDNEPIYSCDKKVDKWVKENIGSIRLMDRSEWKQTALPVSRACYIAFTPEQKEFFWAERFEEVLSLDWSDSERAHILSFVAFIDANPNIFKEGFYNNELYNYFDKFTSEWIEFAKNELEWTNKQIGAVVASGYELIDTDGNLRLNDGENGAVVLSSVSCHCNVSYDFCEDHNCHKPCSNETSNGCGVVWAMSCNGICGPRTGSDPREI